MVQEYFMVTKQLKESLSVDLDTIERLVVAPTGDFITILDQVKKVLVKRSHKLVDYDRFRESAQKLRDRRDKSVSDEKKLGQLEGSLDQASQEFFNIDNQIKQDLPVFLNLRIDFINPCLFIFYTYQLKVYKSLYDASKQLGYGKFKSNCNVISDYESKGLVLEELLGHLTIPKRFSKTASSRPSTIETPEALPAYQPPSASSTGSGSSRGPAPAPPFAYRGAPPPPPIKYVLALYDFEAQAEGDLSFKRDDKIEVIQKTSDVNDWWTGKLRGVTGTFPGK